MTDIFDVSKAILSQFRYGISTRKLQKLTFFSQGWVLALTGKPLFNEDFEAWQFGPVCRTLYAEHKGAFNITSEDLPRGNASKLDETEAAIVRAVIQNYGSLSGDELSEMTHSQGTPWQCVREAKGVKDGQGSNEMIPKTMIREYFTNLFGLRQPESE